MTPCPILTAYRATLHRVAGVTPPVLLPLLVAPLWWVELVYRMEGGR